MEDKMIVDLYWERSEAAIAETEKKYGKYCHTVASRILQSEEDAAECVNDTYLAAWNAMPPHKPQKLSTFLGVVVPTVLSMFSIVVFLRIGELALVYSRVGLE